MIKNPRDFPPDDEATRHMVRKINARQHPATAALVDMYRHLACAHEEIDKAYRLAGRVAKALHPKDEKERGWTAVQIRAHTLMVQMKILETSERVTRDFDRI